MPKSQYLQAWAYTKPSQVVLADANVDRLTYLDANQNNIFVPALKYSPCNHEAAHLLQGTNRPA